MRSIGEKAKILMIILSSAMILLFAANSITAKAQSSGTTLVIYSSLGGTTDPPAGTTQYAEGTVLVLKANPSPGYTFAYWAYSGPQTMRINATELGICHDNPIIITCGDNWTLLWQPVFVKSTSTALPTSSGIQPEYIVVSVVGISSVIGAASFLVGKRRK